MPYGAGASAITRSVTGGGSAGDAVYIDGDTTVAVVGAGDVAQGVLQSDATDGEGSTITFRGVVNVNVAAGVQAGDYLETEGTTAGLLTTAAGVTNFLALTGAANGTARVLVR